MDPAIIGFVLFPLETSVENGGYVYFPGPELRLLLIPLVIMALSLPVLLFFYTLAMHRIGNRKRKRLFALSRISADGAGGIHTRAIFKDSTAY